MDGKIDTGDILVAGVTVDFPAFRTGGENSSRLRARSPILGRRKSCNEKLPPFSCPPTLDVVVFSPGANERGKKMGGKGKRDRANREESSRNVLA